MVHGYWPPLRSSACLPNYVFCSLCSLRQNTRLRQRSRCKACGHKGATVPAERIHADDTTVRVLATGKTRNGRLWTYVRDDRPFGGPDPPAVTFFYSPHRSAKHTNSTWPVTAGLMQADAYAGFNRLYSASRKPGPITEVASWSHARHNFFDLVRLAKAPIAIEAVKRIDELFAIEREINGLPHKSDFVCAMNVVVRLWLRSRLGCASNAQSLRTEQRQQSQRLLPDPMGGADALPRRRAAVHVQQCRRAGDPANRCRSP